MLALVRLQIHRVLRPMGDLEAQVIGREVGSAVEIAGAQADVRDVLQLDHGICPASAQRLRPFATPLNSPTLHSLPQPQSPVGPAANCRGERRCPSTDARSVTKLKWTSPG